MFGIERLSGDAAGTRDRCHAPSQGRHGVTFAGRRNISTHGVGCGRHGYEAVFLAPGF